MKEETVRCIYCGGEELEEVLEYRELNRITSDCKPWPSGGRFAVCRDCHYPQTVIDEQWRQGIRDIYASYQVYFQSGGQEQSVYDPVSGQPMLRSDRLVHCLKDFLDLGKNGRMLDIGCANGNFLRAFAKVVKGWEMNGVEWDEKYLPEVMAIPGFVRLYSDGMNHVPAGFDLITLIHCFEHIPDPGPMLRSIYDKLEPRGLLFIDVPDCSVNPFVLVIADHSSHFSLASLLSLVEQAGFEIVCASDSWLAKEISIVARKGEKSGCQLQLEPAYGEQLKRHIGWMQAVSFQANELAKKEPIGIFGTSIAATWLWAEVGGRVSFFVDEDPNRINNHHCGIPIFSPSKAPRDTPIFLALPPVVCDRVEARLSTVLQHFVRPPSLP